MSVRVTRSNGYPQRSRLATFFFDYYRTNKISVVQKNVTGLHRIIVDLDMMFSIRTQL